MTPKALLLRKGMKWPNSGGDRYPGSFSHRQAEGPPDVFEDGVKGELPFPFKDDFKSRPEKSPVLTQNGILQFSGQRIQ